MKQKEIDQIEEMHRKYHGRCFECGDPATQRAHIIGNTKANIKKYGKSTVDSPFNWLPACGLKCNALIDIGHSPSIEKIIVSLIDLQEKEPIDLIVSENIERKKIKSLS